MFKNWKVIKKHYFEPIFQIVILFFISIILICLWEFFDLHWYELTIKFIEKSSEIIMITTATLIAFIAVFYVFRFRVLTENKRICGFRKRIFKEKINESKLISEKISDNINEENWEKIKQEYIEYEGEYKYNKIFEECGRRDFFKLKEKYKKTETDADDLRKIFDRSIIYAFSIIFFAYLSMMFFDKVNGKCVECIVTTFFIAMNIIFIIFIILIVLDIPEILEGWIVKKSDD